MAFCQFSRGFRKLIAWQRAHALVLEIYKTTASYPKQERYGISDQLRRAGASVAAQIAEGSQMATRNHQHAYYVRALGSLSEVDYFLQLSYELKYLTDMEYEMLLESINKTAFLLGKLIMSCKRSNLNNSKAPIHTNHS